MTPFRSFTMVKHPIEQIWAAMRDRLPEVAVYLDDLESIVTLERSHGPDGRLLLLNRWHARQRIPSILQGMLGTDVISWIDQAEWNDATFCCEWRITPSVLPDYIDCHGMTRYEPAMAGRGTRVSFDGTFELRPGALSRIPATLEPAIVGLVENIVSTVIPRNLAKAINSAGQLIGDSARMGTPASTHGQPSSQA